MARDPLRYFRVEARELLEQLGQGVLDLEKERHIPDVVARLLRLAHTLKGAARVVRRPEIAERAHAIEDVLTTVRESGAPIARERVDSLLTLLDDIGAHVATLTQAAGAGVESSNVATDELFRAFRPDSRDMDALVETLAEAHGHLGNLRPLGTRLQRAKHLADLLLDHLDSPGDRELAWFAERGAPPRARALALDLRSTFEVLERDFAHRVDSVGREFQEARQAAERLRLVPASALFTLLERTARDTAQSLGKRVVFEGIGSDVRVDVHILGVVQGALVQVVRNAVAHGVESPPERAGAGKSAQGRVSIEVARRGRRMSFVCRDDGRGVDLDEVRRLARGKGLLPLDRDSLGPEELLGLLLRGGISTSARVTDMSGRGIGLDVVREASERLGGEAIVRTEAGHGTTIEITCPFTLASVPVLRVESLGATVLLPMDAVRGSLRPSPAMIQRTPHGHTLLYQNQSIPLGTLAPACAAEGASIRAKGTDSVVVLQGREGLAAFAVDRVIGTVTVIVRPLPDLAPSAPYVGGAAIDEEGVPELVLDPEALVAAAERTLAFTDQPQTAVPPILVIDDSLTTRTLEQSILESAGYVVDLATSGEQALAKARDTRYALFLVDVEMPGMDGFTFIERARADPALHEIPSIIVTSRNSPADQRRGQEVGARAYVVKSAFDQSALLERIRELVG
jgi:two-component system chemotaxis sensor kinase CheA